MFHFRIFCYNRKNLFDKSHLNEHEDVFMSTNTVEQQINYYVEKLVPHAEQVYRLSFLLTLNEEKAKKCLAETYEIAADHIDSMITQEKDLYLLVKYCWQALQSMDHKHSLDDHTLSHHLKDLTKLERGVLGSIDFLGLSHALTASAFDINDQDMIKNLAKARQHIVDDKNKG